MGGNALAKPVSVLEIIEDEDSEKNSGSQGILNLIDYSKNKNNQINDEDAINANNDQNGLSQMTTEIKCKTWLDTNADHYNTKPWDVEDDLKNNRFGKITDQVLAHSEIDLSKKEDNNTDTKETTTTTKDDSKDISKEKSSKNESPSSTPTSPSEAETTTEDSDADTEVSKDKSPKLKDVNSKENAHQETIPVSASNTPTKTPVSASNTPTKTPESSSKPTIVTSSDSKQQTSEENVDTKTSTLESSTPETTPDSKESEDVDIPQSPQQHITVKSFTLAPIESSASPNPSFTRQRANTSYYRAEPNASQTDKQVEDKVNQDLQEAEQQDPSQLYPCSYSFFSYFYPSETDDGIMAFRHHILAEAGRKFIKGDRLRLFKKKHRDAFEDRRIRKVEYQSNCRIHICKLNRDKFIKGLPRRRIIVFGQNFDDIHLALRCLEETIPEIMEHALFHKPFPHTSKQFQSRSSFTVRKYVSPYLFHRKVVVGPYIQRAWHKLILPHRIIPPVSKQREFDNDENKKDFEEKRPQSRLQGEVLYNALLKSENPVFTEVNKTQNLVFTEVNKSQNNSESKKTSSSKQESNFPSRQSECNQNSHSYSAHNQSVSHKSNNSSTKRQVKKLKQHEKSRSTSRSCRSQDVSHSSALNDSADSSNSKSPASVKTEESVKTDVSTEPKDGIRVLKFPYTPTTAALLRHDSNGMSMSNRLSRIESICSCKVKKITPLFGEDYLVTHFKIKVYFTDLNAISEFCHYLGFNF